MSANERFINQCGLHADLFADPSRRRAFLAIRYLASRNIPITLEELSKLLCPEDMAEVKEALKITTTPVGTAIAVLELHRCYAMRTRGAP